MNANANKSDSEKLKILLEWKKRYIDALIDALNPVGDVLEVGFGIGIAADRIHTFHPITHTIIEANPQVLAEAKNWANRHSNTTESREKWETVLPTPGIFPQVLDDAANLTKKNPKATIIQGQWETVLPTLGKFDAIFFNDYPLQEDLSIMNFLFPEDSIQATNKARELLKAIEEQMAQQTTQFSDREIDNFYQKTGRFNLKELPRFFKKLQENGNISETQLKNIMKKYHLENFKAESAKTKTQEVGKQPDNMLQFLEACLKNHMKKGGRFTCFLNSQTSKYEDSQFFENIITNPFVDYKENSVPVKMADKTREALIMLVVNST